MALEPLDEADEPTVDAVEDDVFDDDELVTVAELPTVAPPPPPSELLSESLSPQCRVAAATNEQTSTVRRDVRRKGITEA